MAPTLPSLGITYIRLAPRVAKDSSTIADCAAPKESTEITADTPIRMPSMVRIDLSLLPSNARMAAVKQSQIFMPVPLSEIQVSY
jgi:hypothetical protein